MFVAGDHNKRRVSCLILLFLVAAIFVIFFIKKSDGIDYLLINGGEIDSKVTGRIIDAAHSNDDLEFETLLEEEPALLTSLITSIRSFPIDRDWSDNEINKFISLSELMNGLLDSRHKELVMSRAFLDVASRDILSNYLQAFISRQKRAGNGAVVNVHDEAIQKAVFESYKLEASLQNGLEIDEQLELLVAWYKYEVRAKSSTSLLTKLLLSHSWKLSGDALGFRMDSHPNESDIELNSELDLVRILSHQHPQVVKKAANLLAYFAPENAITALTYQLVKNQDSEIRFIILDAMKAYGQHREEIKSQLNKMLRTSKDKAFQRKLIETIDHLNGRSGSSKLSS